MKTLFLAISMMAAALISHGQQNQSKIYNYRTDSVQERFLKNAKWGSWVQLSDQKDILIRVDLDKYRIDIYGNKDKTYFITHVIDETDDKISFNCVDKEGNEYYAEQFLGKGKFSLSFKFVTYELKYLYHTID